MQARPLKDIQSVVALLPAVEPAVRHLRSDADPWAARGMSAHITGAGRGPRSLRLPADALAHLARRAAPTPVTLDRVGVLGDAVCLLLADDSAILDLRAAVVAAVGVPDAKDGGWRPHLTVCRAATAATLRRVTAHMADRLPIHTVLGRLAVVQAPGDGTVALTRL